MEYSKIIQNSRSEGGILDVLKAVQAAEGYLSEEGIRAVAEAYGKYPSEVYETATFYTMLSVGEKSHHMVEVCGSTCCDASGAAAVVKAITAELGIGLGEITEDKKWLFRRCECLGRCDTAPNVIIDGKLLTNATAEKVVATLRKAGK